MAPSERRVFVGEKLRVTYRATAATGPVDRDRPDWSRSRGGGQEQGGRTAGGARRDEAFGTSSLEPGDYDVILVSGGVGRLARAVLAVQGRDAETKVWTSKRTYLVGEPIEVSWRAAPGFRWDWLGVYSPGNTADEPAQRRLQRRLREQRPLPALRLHEDRDRGHGDVRRRRLPGHYTWPLKAGTYEIRFLVDDSYRSIAVSANFKVVKP